MELICTCCFANPVAAHSTAAPDATEILVCDLGAVALRQDTSGHDPLRCSYCRKTVHLNHHRMAWYGY